MPRAIAQPKPATTRRHQKPAVNIAAQIEELLRIRREADDTVAFLVDLLDEKEGDADLEEEPDIEEGGDDEWSLGWTDSASWQFGPLRQHGYGWYRDSRDLEEEDDGREDGGDNEPSLGSFNIMLGRVVIEGSASWPEQTVMVDPGIDQCDWVGMDDRDGEAEFDGREPDVDDEDGHDHEGCYYEDGIADHHALDDPTLSFQPVGIFDGSGRRVARQQLAWLEARVVS